jgi:probable rRNA maturation factor
MSAAARPARAAPKKIKKKQNQKKANPVTIDILVESTRWKGFADSAGIVRSAVMAAAAALSTPRAELAIVLSDDSAVRELNRRWRGVDTATNVLSFPAAGPGGDRLLLGDIVLACETIAAEADEQRKPFAHHLAHLAVHGFLHLLGYDHERNKDAILMERIERNILQRLAIPDPYQQLSRARAQPRRNA